MAVQVTAKRAHDISVFRKLENMALMATSFEIIRVSVRVSTAEVDILQDAACISKPHRVRVERGAEHTETLLGNAEREQLSLMHWRDELHLESGARRPLEFCQESADPTRDIREE